MPNLNLVYVAQFPPYLNAFSLGGALKPITPWPGGTLPSTTQAATMANASANIAVPNLSAFNTTGFASLVQFSASANGFLAATNYYVTSAVGGNIQVSAVPGGAAIVATGNTPVNVSVFTGAVNAAYVDATQVPPSVLAAAGFTILTTPGQIPGLPAVMVQPYAAISNNQP
jgi:hypothetical protein